MGAVARLLGGACVTAPAAGVRVRAAGWQIPGGVAVWGGFLHVQQAAELAAPFAQHLGVVGRLAQVRRLVVGDEGFGDESARLLKPEVEVAAQQFLAGWLAIQQEVLERPDGGNSLSYLAPLASITQHHYGSRLPYR